MKVNLTESSFSEITLRDLYFVIFRHKKKILTVFFTAVFISLYYFFTTPDMYWSEASLLIKVGRESLELIPTADKDRLVSVSRSRIQDLNNEVEIIKSRDIFEKLVDEIGFETFLRKSNPAEKLSNKLINPDMQEDFKAIRESVVLRLMKDVDINIKTNTNIIGISYRSKSPQLANTVVSKLIDIFFEKHIDIHYSGGSYEFFKDQSEKSLMVLNKVELKLAEIKNELNIGSVDEYVSVLSDRIETLQQQVDQGKIAIAESKSKVQALKNSLNNLPEVIETEEFVDHENILEKLYALQLRERELLSKYTKENIQIKEIHLQIEEIKKLFSDKSYINRSINTSYNQLRQDLITEQTLLAKLQVKDAELNKMLSDVKKERALINVKAFEISQLERERDILSVNYLRYSGNLEEARIDQIVLQQKLSNITILQPATYPIKPEANRKFRNIAMGIFLGFFGSIGLAFILEFIDHSIKTPEDVEKRLHLRTLAVIPERYDK